MKKVNTYLVFVLCFVISQVNAQLKDHVSGEFIVYLSPTANVESFCQDVQVFKSQPINLRPKKRLAQSINLWLMESDIDPINETLFLQNLKQHNDVIVAQFNHTTITIEGIPSDSRFSSQWNLNNAGQSGGTMDADIDAAEAWDITIGGKTALGDDIVVAVIDDGFDLSHEDLVENLWKNTNEIPGNGIDDDANGYIDDYDGWNALSSNGVLTSASHGTHVAGIIGAKGNNAKGVSGIAWDVKIMPIQIPSSVINNESAILEAYGYALDQRALYNQTNGMKGAFVVVSNASFGIDGAVSGTQDPNDYPMWCNMYDYLGYNGILNVTSCGNSGSNIDDPAVGHIPASCSSIYKLSVGNTDRQDARFTTSNYGSISVDLDAPGTDIRSSSPGDTYLSFTGSSMAAPHVTGAIALLYSAVCDNFLSYQKNNLSMSVLRIKEYILNGVDPVVGLSTVSGGRLNLHNSLKLLTSSLELELLNGTNGFTIGAGQAVNSAGDINGDGFDDIIIGVPSENLSYVSFGKASGFPSYISPNVLNGSNGFTIYGINLADAAGNAVSVAGDMNGDGLDDLIIGAYAADQAIQYGSSAGASYVLFGTNSAFQSSLNLSSLNGTNGFIIEGIDGGDESGISVSTAGDFNGDGLDDILIGAQFADPNGNLYAGESYLVFGRLSAFSSSFNLSSLNGTNGFIINGINGGDLSGASVNTAGDLNGDGFDDIIIGASAVGQSYVIFGNNTTGSAIFNLNQLNGSNGFVIDRIDGDDRTGTSVSSAGDINGDGFDDIIVGAPHAYSQAGASYVIYGRQTAFPPVLNPNTLNGIHGFVISGITMTNYSGSSVSSAGDIDGDGFDDFMIGAWGGGSNSTGETYVIFGTNSEFNSPFNLSNLNGMNGFLISGLNVNDYAGRAVSSAGDVNGDGFDDMIVAAPGAHVDGESYVIFGDPDRGAIGQPEWQCHQSCLLTRHFDNETINSISSTTTNHSINTSGNVTITSGSSVSLKAKEYIYLGQGFEVLPNSQLELSIEGCQ